MRKLIAMLFSLLFLLVMSAKASPPYQDVGQKQKTEINKISVALQYFIVDQMSDVGIVPYNLNVALIKNQLPGTPPYLENLGI